MQAVLQFLDDKPRTVRELVVKISGSYTRYEATYTQKACMTLVDYGYALCTMVERSEACGPKMVMAWYVDPSARIPKCFYTSRGKTIGYAMVSILEAIDAKGEITTRWVAENLFATDRVREMVLEDKSLFFEALAWAQMTMRRLEATGLIAGQRSKDEYGRNNATIWRRT